MEEHIIFHLVSFQIMAAFEIVPDDLQFPNAYSNSHIGRTAPVGLSICLASDSRPPARLDIMLS